MRSVIRFAYLSCIQQYKEIQELPSGTSRADIVYVSKKGSAIPVIIVELKGNKGARKALEQIRERNYPEIFEAYGENHIQDSFIFCKTGQMFLP
ncbi:hypothetical protein NSB25_00345 [Acetatifactor muris]|uniref:Uncharacterized protein n=1 Tax=Acetatifactor muris TaxID=879566 RepID=A0A2K4ZG82_9FIRM|nr:hypothetical protein [Acetatifactor muris]MCR2045736.1 hypothetical protein [Acetatifactor muris]SOY29473.1 hypothetical protein AMURIS_02194 [Acetatifactor muris]